MQVPGGAVLADLGSPVLDQRGFTISYWSGSGNGIYEIHEFRGAPGASSKLLLRNTYQELPSGSGIWRVTSQTDAHGKTHAIAYQLGAGSGATTTTARSTGSCCPTAR